MRFVVKKILKYWKLRIDKIHPIEPLAEKIYDKYKDFTMMPKHLFVDNLKLVFDYRHVEGCIVECGVWRGGMSAGIAEILPHRIFYLFDSFEGLPEPKEIDGEEALFWKDNIDGETYYNNCSAEMDFAHRAMKKSGANYELIKGWFTDTLHQVQTSPIAVLRLDADWYDSTLTCLTHLYSKVTKGGIIILDDYYAWDGCSRALHHYLSENLSVSRIYSTTSGVCYVIKKD